MAKRKGRAPTQDWSALDRHMFADDFAWIASQANSVESDPDWKAVLGLTLTPHIARVVHEGHEWLRHSNKGAAVRVLIKHKRQIAAARHAVKLIDDREKLYEGLVSDFRAIAGVQDKEFRFGWNNFAAVEQGSRLLTTARSACFHVGLNVQSGATFTPFEGNAFGEDMGQALGSIAIEVGLGEPRSAELELPSGPAPTNKTQRSEAFYRGRYVTEFAEAEKDIVSVVEGTVNTALVVMAPAQDIFPGAVFRVRTLTAIHAVRALSEVMTRHPEIEGRREVEPVLVLLAGNDVSRLISRSGTLLRHRCMHYRLPGHLTGLTRTAPDYGLVKAVDAGSGYDDFNGVVIRTLTALSRILGEWRTP
jgi:hypothetical protein